MMYQQLGTDESLTQGDVLDGCPIVRASPDGTFARLTARVVILTQACDLAQTRSQQVAVAVVLPAEEVVSQGELKASTIRDQVRRGHVFGWYFLPAAPDPIALQESIVNLRDLHTVSKELLMKLATAGKRVCRLLSPYREHLAQHFAVTYMRIALPEPYETRP